MEKYNGNKNPFIFFAYSGNDIEEAERIAEKLKEKAKIYASDSFTGKDRKALEKAALVVPVISRNSEDKLEEVVSAATAKGKEILPVFIENTELSPSMSLQLGTTQGHLRSKFDDEDAFLGELVKSPLLSDLRVSKAQKKSSGITMITGIVMALIAIAVILILALQPFYSGRIDKDSLLGKMGLSGRASSIKSVYIYGNELEDELEDKGVHQAIANTASNKSLMYLPLADKIVPLGEISDLSDFSQLVNLEELSLSGNRIKDLTPILSLSKLRKLDLSNQQYDDSNPEDRENLGLSLKGISQLKNLEYLNLAYNYLEEGWGIYDLEEIKELPNLKTLVVDITSDIPDTLGETGFEIVYIGTFVSSYEELKAAVEDPECHTIVAREGSKIVIPDGEEFTLPKKVLLSGTNFELTVDGTMFVDGWVECGLDNENVYGKVVIKKDGSWVGGMSTLENFGEFIVEEGGLHIIERGKQVRLKEGSYTNYGTLIIGAGGSLEYSGGSATNDGKIIVEIAAGDFPFPENWFENKIEIVERFSGKGTIETTEVTRI